MAELRSIHRKLEAIQEVAGGRYRAQVGVLKDYDNCWDLRIDMWHRDLENVSQPAIFAAAQKIHTPLDYVYLSDEGVSALLSAYKVLIYAHPCMMSEARAAILEEYVAGGGILILGCRSGYKDLDGHCVMQDLPGLLRPLTGADIPEFTRTCPGDSPVTIRWGDRYLEAPVFNDLLQPLAGEESAEVLGIYENCYYAGEGALLRHRCRKGVVYSLGTVFTEELTAALLEEVQAAEPERETMVLPECCELAIREKDGKKYYFVLNYSADQVTILLKRSLVSLFDGVSVEGELALEPYGTAVLK